MPIPMPTTAEQAHAAAKQAYKAMLHHAAAGEVYLTADAAAKFQNAAELALMYELRQIRLALMEQRRERGRFASDDELRELKPATPDVPHDGFAVNGRSR